MSGYVVLPRARADLKEIWGHTANRWSTDQADRYVRTLHQGIETVAHDPRRGKPCDHIRRGYHKYSVGAHVVFSALSAAASRSFVSCISGWISSGTFSDSVA